MVSKNGIIIMTLISALLFCLIPVVVSLSPLADLGPNANQFGSIGMWAAIACFAVLYAAPLFIYMLGVDGMRYVMAVLCGFGLLINFISIGTMLIISFFAGIAIADLLGVFGLYIAASIVNIIWFIIAFRPPAKVKHNTYKYTQ